jgi:crotonobetainyl-CoA:carnitine CoA-transferase CaiB-like acyl-CoA transferase
LISGLEIDAEDLPDQMDVDSWPKITKVFELKFKSKSQEEWRRVFEKTDACVSPVIEMAEAHLEPHNRERGIIAHGDGGHEPMPAPRFSSDGGKSYEMPRVRMEMPQVGQHSIQILKEFGVRGVDSMVSDGLVLDSSSKL